MIFFNQVIGLGNCFSSVSICRSYIFFFFQIDNSLKANCSCKIFNFQWFIPPDFLQTWKHSFTKNLHHHHQQSLSCMHKTKHIKPCRKRLITVNETKQWCGKNAEFAIFVFNNIASFNASANKRQGNGNILSIYTTLTRTALSVYVI